MDTPVERRLQLLDHGHVPTPVNGKAAVAKGWQAKIKTNGDEIAVWSAVYPGAINTGILTQITPAIDIDITFQPAAEAIEQLAREEFEEHGNITVRFGKPPKRAILLRTDEPFEKITACFTAPDGSEHRIECLGKGQQLVVHGIHPDTHKPYTWHGGAPWEISREHLPYVRRDDIIEFLEKAAKLLTEEYGFTVAGGKSHKKGNGEDYDSLYGGGADWTTLVGNIIAGRDLHDSTVSLAAAYIACGMSEHGVRRSIEALFLTSDCPRDERWKARFDEIPRAVRSAVGKFGKSQPKATQPAGICSRELRDKMFEPIKYVVRGVIVEGLTLLAAKPKIGKSWLMLHIAIAVARGGFTLGEIHCEEGDVLYAALEDNQRRLKSRMAKLLGLDVEWPERLRFETEMPRLIDGGIDAIRQWIESVSHPRLVVIDTLAMVRAPKRRDESSYDADYAAVKELRGLANEHGVAIVIIHHLRKAESDDPFDTVSGTLGLTGAPDTILVLRRDASGAVILHGRGRDLVEIEKAVTFSKDACTWTITGSAAEARASGSRKAILDALKELGEPATPTEIASLAGLKHSSVKHLVLKMVKAGTLKEPASRI